MNLRHITLFLVLLCVTATAQKTAYLDSLRNVFLHGDARTRVQIGMGMMNEQLTTDPQASVDLGNVLLALVDSMEHAGMTPADKANRTRGSMLSTMANAYHSLGDVEAQMDHVMRSLDLAQEAGDTYREAMGYEALGVAYQEQGHMDEALNYYRKARTIFQELGDTYHLALELGNVGQALLTTHPDSTLWYYKRSLSMMERPDMLDREGAMGWMLNNIGGQFERLGQLDSALHYYHRSLAIRESVDHRLGQYLVHRDIAELLQGRGQLQQALDHVNTSIRIAEENNFRAHLYSSFQLRSDILAKLGRFSEALRDHKRYMEQRDSIVSDRNTKDLVQQTMRYEYGRRMLADSLSFEAEKAVQVQEIEKQKVMRNGFMGGFALVALFAGVFFFQRNRISKEKARSEELLLNILPEEVAEELKDKGSANAKRIDLATVLFTDFKGFTAYSENLSPEQLVHDLNECFTAFDHIIAKHGMEKIKTIGDAYMAAGGLPVANSTHASDTVKAALEIRDFIAEGKARKIAAGLPFFEIRIGIHTGPVVAGIVGVKKFSYDIWGDTVNTASRMESSGEVGQVNISETTYEMLKNEPGLDFTSRGKVQAKGKGEMEMYFVEQADQVGQA